MCKQKNYSVITNRFANNQKGFSLVMVMMIMVVIALLVIAGAQVSNTEMRISTNNADQKYAKGLAERALLEGEKLISKEGLDATGSTVKSKSETDLLNKFNNTNGLYGYNGATTRTETLWEDSNTWTGANSVEVTFSGGSKKPRYIVEYLGTKDVDGETGLRVFRVTARAWGENENTVSTLQSVVVAPSS